MKANELRIGNYATDSIQTGAITVFNNDACVLKHKSGIVKCRISDLSPVPLTEEWLLKFGFKQISERVYIKNYHYGYEFGITNIFIIKNDNCFMRYKHIKHVHELQNLYFALTGEELTL